MSRQGLQSLDFAGSQDPKMDLKTIILVICSNLVLHYQLVLGLGINLGLALQDSPWKDLTDNRVTQPEWVCDENDARIIGMCSANLLNITYSGFPWISQLKARRGNHDTLKDPMDPINRVCEAYDQFLRCVEQHAVKLVCLITSVSELTLYTDFKFICKQPRSTTLLHVLGCLQETKSLDLLLYHLADRYGVPFMEQYVNGNTNAFFRFLNNPVLVSQYYVSPTWLDAICGESLFCFSTAGNSPRHSSCNRKQMWLRCCTFCYQILYVSSSLVQCALEQNKT